MRDGRGPNLYSLIDPWIEGVSFQVNTQSNNVIFIFQTMPGLDLIERLEKIQTIVIQSVNLIKLFEDKGYIFTFINANQLPPNPFIFGQAAINLPSIPYQFPDPRISKMFCEYSIKEIYITPELDKFINDGFITREEWRANRQWKTTRITLYVAITALLFNIGINLSNLITRKSNTIISTYNKVTNPTDSIQINKRKGTTIINDTVVVTKTLTNSKTDTLKR